ncbi:Pyridoxamine 5'-phosphate oxidase [Anaerosphaera aminiphila DSM 21120]|uniref:Pyridoxamine 5'-phosphate oxidase n=1 Tax=Anaerosphaera aminiphila DSM 21120 TaxID=1120995 RepID=A0A1M5SPB9_9FIRM|nr:pyridoxamine 5'-phosphate oxidase family protein [Anaerosphaera aminiphila]SHH40332.1 Pyridoxamine 5'-phosphate oxidase [Anaerosphaera aminiphila DSM 21120]
MKEFYELLNQNKICTLATSSSHSPRASIVEYIIVDDSILFATYPDSIKAKNLSENKNISLSISSLPQFSTIDGEVCEPTESEKDTYTKIFLERTPEFSSYVVNSRLPFTYFKIKIKKAFYNASMDTETKIIEF